MNNFAKHLFFIGMVVSCACAEVQVIGEDGSPNGNTDSSQETDSRGTDTSSIPDSNGGTDTISGSDEDSAQNTDPVPDTETDLDTIPETDSDTHSDSDSDSGTATGTDSETDDNSGTDTDTDTGSSTDPEASMFVRFRENIQFFPYYNSHRLLAGPSSSQSPEDGSWVLIAGAAAMKNTAANDSWSTVSLDATAPIRSLSQTNIRLAFHYEGTSADDWWLDDICVGKTANSCDLFGPEDFSGVIAGDLPAGWSDVEGSDNASSSHDWSVDLPTFDIQRAVGITFDNAQISRYLTSPVIALD